MEGHTVDELDHLTRPDVLSLPPTLRRADDPQPDGYRPGVLLDACPPHFKFVARWGVGTDHIDLDYANEKGIKVFNSPEGSKHTVAEHHPRYDAECYLTTSAAPTARFATAVWVRRGNIGTELGHLTVGLIGYGNMGRMTRPPPLRVRLQGAYPRQIP